MQDLHKLIFPTSSGCRMQVKRFHLPRPIGEMYATATALMTKIEYLKHYYIAHYRALFHYLLVMLLELAQITSSGEIC